MKRLKVHVLYEFGQDLRPHGSAFLRLIRPLSYPALLQHYDITFGRELGDRKPDLVLVDRLWNPYEVTPELANKLMDDIRSRGAKIIHCFDDNFLDPDIEEKGITSVQIESFRSILNGSDGQIVTTPELRKKFLQYQSQVVVIPHALDEQLIVRKSYVTKDDQQKIVIGYMGTATHNDDLEMVLPALRRICEQYPNRLHIQIIGVLDNQNHHEWDNIKKVPLEIVQLRAGESEYPLFMLWFTGTIRWDIAIAPLVDTHFNRCKSDIKYLDYTAASVPGLYSNLPVYGTVINGETGLLLGEDNQEWFEALDEMIRYPQLRSDLINNARAYLYGKRILGAGINDWVRAFEEFA